MHYLTERRTAGQDLVEEDLTLCEARLSASGRPPLARIRNVGGNLIFSRSLRPSVQKKFKIKLLICRSERCTLHVSPQEAYSA